MTKNVYQSYGCFCRRGLGYNKDSQGHQEMFIDETVGKQFQTGGGSLLVPQPE